MQRPSNASPAVNDSDTRLIIAVHGKQDNERITGTHRHSHGQLFGANSGLVTVGTASGQWVVPATHAVWMPPHQAHSMRSHGAFSGWSLYVSESACKMLPDAPRTIRVDALLRAAIGRAVGWDATPLDAVQTRLATVMIDEIAVSKDDGFGLPQPSDKRLLRVTRLLAAAPGNAHSLEEWAEVAAVSARTLSRRFVEQTGFTFSQWRQRARLMRATEMLSAERPVTEVALELGYEDISAFISAFKRLFGVTPAKFKDSVTTRGTAR